MKEKSKIITVSILEYNLNKSHRMTDFLYNYVDVTSTLLKETFGHIKFLRNRNEQLYSILFLISFSQVSGFELSCG